MKKFKQIVCLPESKFQILKKGQDAGLDLRLSCPDNLACIDKGIDITWLGAFRNENAELNQILIVTLQPLKSFANSHPLKKFLNSFDKKILL